jgi:hypothetical protein
VDWIHLAQTLVNTVKNLRVAYNSKHLNNCYLKKACAPYKLIISSGEG